MKIFSEQFGELPREAVSCALCGSNESIVRFTIDTRHSKLPTVWIDNEEYAVESRETIVQCKRCGLVFVNPRLAAQSQIEPYSVAMEMVYFEQTRAARTRAFAHLLQQLPNWLGHQPRNLLDVGCGDGLLIELARHAKISSAGLELSQNLVDVVRKRLGSDAIHECPLEEQPANHYEVVALINVIEHLRDPGVMLRQIARILEPGGILLLHTPNIGGIPARIAAGRWHQIEPFGHFYYFNAQTLNQLLRQTGFLPVARFNLTVNKGAKAHLQTMLGKLGIYLDSGLGIVARRQ